MVPHLQKRGEYIAMMKRGIILLTSLLTVIILVACQQKAEKTTDWLEGNWYSTDWDVTYQIDEEDDKWSIKDGDDVITQDATLSVEDNLYTLTDEKGMVYEIQQISQTEIKYRQIAPDGVLGTTVPIAFEKVDK